METFFKEHGIKHITTKSYVPQANIENLNGQLRHMIREQFIRTNSLAWFPYLQSFADSKDTSINESTRQTPLFLMVSYFQENRPHIQSIAEKVKKRKEERFQKYYKQESFAVGDW